MIRYLLFLILILPMTGCGDTSEGDTGVVGKVIDADSRESLEGVEVYLLARAQGIFGKKEFISVKATKTDATGKFSFFFYAESDRVYKVSLFGDEYLNDSICQSNKANELEKAGANTALLELTYPGWLQIRLINEPPVDTAQEFFVSSIGGSRTNVMYTDTSIVNKSCPRDEKVQYRILSGGKITEGEKTVKIVARDTAEIEIRY
jgi:hypothetical protein